MTAPFKQPLAGAGVEIATMAAVATAKAVGIMIVLIRHSSKQLPSLARTSVTKPAFPPMVVRDRTSKTSLLINGRGRAELTFLE
jgi:hypothetical protein